MRTSFRTTERKRISFTGPRYFSKYGANKVRAQKRKFFAVQPCDRAKCKLQTGHFCCKRRQSYILHSNEHIWHISRNVFRVFWVLSLWKYSWTALSCTPLFRTPLWNLRYNLDLTELTHFLSMTPAPWRKCWGARAKTEVSWTLLYFWKQALLIRSGFLSENSRHC